MNIPAMRTGEMKYVILRIDTHVLRIDLCPRKRTRIRRQKQDEDVHLFLSERKKPAPPRGFAPGYDPAPLQGAPPYPAGYPGRNGIRPPNGPVGPNDRNECTYPAHVPMHVPRWHIRHRWWRPVGRIQYAPTRVPTPTNQRAARPPTLSELWTQKRITRTCSSSCCSS